MKNALKILIGLVCLNCNSQDLTLIDSGDMTKNYDLFNNFVNTYDIFRDIENRSDYKIYEENNFYYLEGNGINKDKNKVIFRIKFTKYESGKLIAFLAGESCVGVDCEHCAFKSSGGCECKKGGGAFGVGICNHTVTK